MRPVRPRVVCLLVCPLALAYASLPAWFPADWLRQRLEAQLARDLGRPVSIERLSLGWADGVVIENLVIGEPPGSPAPCLAKVARIRCELTPLVTLATQRVDHIEVRGPEIWLARDAEGRLNIDSLVGRPASRLPALDYRVEMALCHVLSPRSHQMFRIDALECRLEPHRALLDVHGWAMVPPVAGPVDPASASRLAFEARITVPKLRRDRDLVLGGEIRSEWTRVALTDLPLGLIPRLPVRQESGTTSGRLSVKTRKDLSVDFTQQISFRGVRLAFDGLADPADVPDAEVDCAGRWDPNTDLLELQTLACRTGAIDLHGRPEGREPAVQVDLHGRSFDAKLSGVVRDWQRLRRELPPLQSAADRAGLKLTGLGRFELEAGSHNDVARLLLKLDGRESGWELLATPGPLFAAGADLQKTLELGLVRDRKREQAQVKVDLSIGDLSLAVEGKLPLGPGDLNSPAGDRLMQSLWGATGHVTLATRRAEEGLRIFPAAGDAVELNGWQGPLRAHLALSPEVEGLHASFNLDAPAEAAVRIGNLLLKPVGENATATGTITVPLGDHGEVRDLALEIVCGATRLRLGGEGARVSYHRGDPSLHGWPRWLSAGEAVVPVQLEHAEGLARLCPRWEALLSQDNRQVGGSLAGVVRLQASRTDADTLLSAELGLNAAPFGVRWDDGIDKPAGEPLQVQARARSQGVGGVRDVQVTASLIRPDGTLHATAMLSEETDERDAGPAPQPDSAKRLAHVVLLAQIEDLAAWTAFSPALRRAVEPLRPAGAVSLEAGGLLTDGGGSLDLRIDADRAAFLLPGERPAEKPAGVPAHAAMRWEAASETVDGATAWRMTDARFRLAGMQVDALDARVSETSPVFATLTSALGFVSPGTLSRAPITDPGPQGSSEEGAPALKWRDHLRMAHIRGRGQIAFDAVTVNLHEGLAGLARELGLEGRLSWDVEYSAGTEAARAAARINADGLGMSVPLGHAVFPIFAKAVDSPGFANVVLSSAGQELSGPRRFDTRIDLDWDGNRAWAEGSAWLPASGPPARESSPEPQRRALLDILKRAEADWVAGLRLERPQQLAVMLPGSPLGDMEGGAIIEASIEQREGRARLLEAEARMENLQMAAGGADLRLDGRLAWARDRLSVPGLTWSWGESDGTITGALGFREDAVAGRLGVAMGRLNVTDLNARVLGAMEQLRPGPTTRATGSGPPGEWLDRLSRSRFRIDGFIDTLDVVLPPGIPVRAEVVTHQTLIDNGPVTLTFSSATDGGYVSGSVRTRTDVGEPLMHLAYRADRIQPGPLVQAYLRRSFPGMEATGPLTLIDESLQRLIAPPGEPNHPTGRGELIIEGGSVVGRAAPLWMTRIFPGLNLARFEYAYMHSWFTKEASGRINHQMIYQGRYYNIYMNGYSDPDSFRYEVGIDFLADFNSRYWAESGQGRIPLFVKTGRLQPDGKIENEEVNYLPPQRVLEVLLVRNNPMVTAYHAVRKRVRAEQ